MMRNNLALWALVGSALFLQPAAGAMYKWIDADGNVVYSQTKPPGGVPAEEIKKRSTGVSDEESAQQLEGLRDKADAESEDRELKEEIAKEELDRDEVIKKNCEIARHNQTLLETPARVTLTAEDGTEYFLSDEERQEKLLDARAQVERYCD
jgi:hypothetical protein